MDVLKDETKVDSLISILNVIHENPIINPTPQVGDNYAKMKTFMVYLVTFLT